mgnify:CR=1 FL=1
MYDLDTLAITWIAVLFAHYLAVRTRLTPVRVLPRFYGHFKEAR